MLCDWDGPSQPQPALILSVWLTSLTSHTQNRPFITGCLQEKNTCASSYLSCLFLSHSPAGTYIYAFSIGREESQGIPSRVPLPIEGGGGVPIPSSASYRTQRSRLTPDPKPRGLGWFWTPPTLSIPPILTFSHPPKWWSYSGEENLHVFLIMGAPTHS